MISLTNDRDVFITKVGKKCDPYNRQLKIIL